MSEQLGSPVKEEIKPKEKIGEPDRKFGWENSFTPKLDPKKDLYQKPEDRQLGMEYIEYRNTGGKLLYDDWLLFEKKHR